MDAVASVEPDRGSRCGGRSRINAGQTTGCLVNTRVPVDVEDQAIFAKDAHHTSNLSTRQK
jgi:hypothetical protein